MKYLGLLYPGLWNFFWKSFINLLPTLLYMLPNLWNFFGRSSLEGVLKQGLLLLRIFMLNLLNRKKCKSIYTVGFNQIVYISSVKWSVPLLIFRSFWTTLLEKRLLTSSQHDVQQMSHRRYVRHTHTILYF